MMYQASINIWNWFKQKMSFYFDYLKTPRLDITSSHWPKMTLKNQI